ncbi:MAG TPA: alanine racemase, partial [Bryobacteraceae bacterium]
MTTRRGFLAAGAAAGWLSTRMGRAAKSTETRFPISELESRIARRDFRDITKDVLPTPCMVIDLQAFEQNVRTMMDQSRTTGINIRPHVKIHKSVDVAKRQVSAGAIGLTCATVAEAELMSGAGIKHVLWT